MQHAASFAVLAVAACALPACASRGVSPPMALTLAVFQEPQATSAPLLFDAPASPTEPIPVTMTRGLASDDPPADDPSTDDSWQFTVAPYVWAISQKGQMTVNGQKAPLDVGFDDIIKAADMAVLVAVGARRGKTVFRVDQNYLAVSADESVGATNVDVEQTTYFATLKAGHVLGDEPQSPILFIGARYWNLSADIDVTGGGVNISADGSEDWWDPLVGIEKVWVLDERWGLVASGDYGGFGLSSSSDSTWQALVAANYTMDNGDSLLMGWRHLDVEYDSGSGASRFEFDVRITGPIFGWAFRF